MTKFRINLRNVALIVACLAVSMMLVSSCKKDDKKEDNGDNPFVGTWINDDDDDVILNFNASTWTIEDYGDLYCSGTYTHSGNTATLTVTDVGTRGIEKGDVGTAQLSGNTITVIFDEEILLFSKEGGGGGGGDGEPGTESNPFKVANVEDLKRVGSGKAEAEGVYWKDDKYYLQVADIDLSGEANWKPIFANNVLGGFKGTYDGGGYTISNLTIVSDVDYAGLFYSLYGGTVANVRLNKVKISGKDFVGGIAGNLNGGKIVHCSVNDIEITGETEIGGIVGRLHRGGTAIVSNCMATNGTISSNYTDSGIAGNCCGGIVGLNFEGTVENCYATVNVYGYEQTVGGIVGYNTGGSNTNHPTVQYCYATGNITSEKRAVGGIACHISDRSIIQNCVALNKEVKSNEIVKDTIGRIAGNFMPPGGILLDNYARPDMTLMAGSDIVPVTDATTTSIHGADVSAADYAGANSGTWWKNTVGFPESSWDFAPNRLPHLKGFGGLNQNPTVTP